MRRIRRSPSIVVILPATLRNRREMQEACRLAVYVHRSSAAKRIRSRLRARHFSRVTQHPESRHCVTSTSVDFHHVKVVPMSFPPNSLNILQQPRV